MMIEIKLPPQRHMEFRQFFSFNKENFKNRFFIDVLMDKMSPDLEGMLDSKNSFFLCEITKGTTCFYHKSSIVFGCTGVQPKRIDLPRR